MSSTSNGHKASSEPENNDDDDVPASQLTRPTPDAILADEADENALLGDDSDAGSSRRDSFGSAADGSETRRISQNLAVGGNDVTATPTQAKFVSKQRVASNRSRSGPFGYKTTPNVDDLQAQISDLTNQVTGLNTKLVTSFMRISDLEDDLSDKHHQLSIHQEKVTSLEKEREEHLAALNTGLLVEKAHVTSEMQKMMDKIIEETAQRGKAVSDKEKIEAELDELSSSLFSEANKMVAAERLARARADEKSRNMEERLKDTEEMMEQQQKRLVEMQSTMELVEKGRTTSYLVNGSTDASGSSNFTRGTDLGEPALPALTRNAVRLDVVPYVELRGFLNHLRKLRLQLAPFYNYHSNGTGPSSSPSPVGSRTASPGPNGTRNVPPVPLSVVTLTASSAHSPFTAAGVNRHKDFPNLPANVEQLITVSTQVASNSFLKRMNEEDCEPCLRLDAAPGLNWLSRRQMHASIVDGNLLIEPVFGGGRFDEAEIRHRSRGTPPAACAMCGKAVLNVPLPGGVVADAGLSSPTIPSAHAREPSGSPPSNSNTFHNTTNANSSSPGRLTQKKSSTGLFSTLRNMGAASPRPSISTNNSSSSLNAVLNKDSLVEEDPFASRKLPIPTHIFRISESSNRYLLCPDYCLGRLRVTCNFWGYIRHLERAVVLEGKLAWDEEGPDNKRLKEVVSPNLSERPSESDTVAALDAAAEDGKLAEAAIIVENVDESDEKHVMDGAISEAISKENVEDNDDGPKISDTRRSSLTISTDGEEGFADAQSVHSGTDQMLEEETTSEEKSPLDSDNQDKPDVEKAKEEEEELQPAPTPTQKHLPIPPLPPRSAIRRPVPRPPQPPTLPARQASTPALSQVEGPEPRRAILAKGETNLTWEEKVWLEMLRHKADMWSARVGLYDLQSN